MGSETVMSESADHTLLKMGSTIERLLERIDGMKETMDSLRASVEKAVSKHDDLKLEQARMDERLRTVEREMGALKRDTVAADKAHEDRLTAVEHKMIAWGAVITAAGAGVTILIELAFKAH